MMSVFFVKFRWPDSNTLSHTLLLGLGEKVKAAESFYDNEQAYKENVRSQPQAFFSIKNGIIFHW